MSSQGRGAGGGGGYSEIFIHMPGLFFGVQNLEFQYFLGFSKKKYFGGYEDFVYIFGGSPQNWPIFRGCFYAF